jgi:hypothetical protein
MNRDGEGRLRDAQPLRCTRKVKLLCHGEEVTQLPEFHFVFFRFY